MRNVNALLETDRERRLGGRGRGAWEGGGRDSTEGLP